MKDNWTATVSDGAALATATNKAITAQSTKNYIAAAALAVSKDDTSVYYNVEFKSLVDSAPPKLSAGTDAATRSSHEEATVTFNSDETGVYYYAVADSESPVPTVDTSGEGTAMVAGDNTINLTDLTAGAKKLYLKAKDESGNITTEALVIDIPAYVEETYSLYLTLTYAQYNAGWRFTGVNANGQALEIPTGTINSLTITDIKANQRVIVSLNIPDGTKELKSVSLMTNDDKAPVPAEVTGYNSFTFTMPTANVRSSTGGWFELQDTNQTRYTLSATVTKLWEDQAYQETNLKGYVTFTDKNGAAITQACAGDTVKVTATPRNTGGYYEFAFDQWKDISGITIEEAKHTSDTLTFTMPANDVSLFAAFKNVGTTVTWGATPEGAPHVWVNGNTRDTTYVYRTGSTAVVRVGLNGEPDWHDAWTLLRWKITVDGVDRSDDPTVVTGHASSGYPDIALTGNNVVITAVFQAKAFAGVTAAVNDASMGSATATVGSDTSTSHAVVYEGQTVTLTATPGERYNLDHWEVKDKGGATIDVTTDGNTATFTMPDTGKDITATAYFAVDPDKASANAVLESVSLYAADGTTLVKAADREGMSFTITLPADQDVTNLGAMILKLSCSQYATVKQKGAAENWPSAGKACNMTLDTPVTFVVTAEDGKTANEYTIEIKQEQKQLSSEKAITSVELIYSGKTFASGELNEATSTWTVTLDDDIDPTLLGKIGTATDVFMKIDYTGASLAQSEGYDDAGFNDKWDSGKIMCGVSPGGQQTFTVTAENGSTKDYFIAITQPSVSGEPVLSNGNATRTSDTAATVTFTSSAAGSYYYKVVTSGAAEPDIDTSKSGNAAVAGSNTITLNNLTAGARDIYIVVKNAAGEVSNKLKIAILAFGEDPDNPDNPDEGDFKITYTGPSGGKLVPSRTKANAGDVITVTVVPDAGMQMVAGSMKYTLGVAGGESTPITDGTFTMPSADVTLSCKWEAVKTSTDGITAFTIDGVAGVVDNTTNTISVVMAYGTDVTKLIPIISGNNIASISPASGQMVDFTTSVRYTVTLTDGTVKHYTVTVYVQEGTAADKMWDKLTDFYDQTPWWEYAEHQTSTGSYPKYW